MNKEDVTYNQEWIGILRWAGILGLIDIALEVIFLSTHLALPQQGQLQAASHIFAYLSNINKQLIYINPKYHQWSDVIFPKYNWTDFYKDATEEIQVNIPEPLVKPMQITCFVDVDHHVANKKTRRSQTGIIIFINGAPISWLSKHQVTVETSTFGSEFVPMTSVVEQIQVLRFKLRWFGIPVEILANVFCDTNLNITSATQPEVTLQKKHKT
jgi:hypothetical protein